MAMKIFLRVLATLGAAVIAFYLGFVASAVKIGTGRATSALLHPARHNSRCDR